MATTTPNFGWPVPTSTDLVKDGATAMEALGDAIDTSMVDLKGGTTGQVLSKTSNTDMDFTWVTDATGIPATIFDAKGDIIAATAADTASRLAVGTNGQVLTADSTAATGLKWATAGGASGALTKISTTTFTNVATQDIDSVFSSTYNSYLIAISGVYAGTQADDLHLQMRYSTNTEATGYNGAIDVISYLGTSAITGANAATQMTLSLGCGASNFPTSATFNLVFPNNGGSSSRTQVYGQGFNSLSAEYNSFGYDASNPRVYTGFRLKSSSSNISGTVVVYGLEK